MRKLILVAALVLLAVAPLPASAQQKPAQTPAAPSVTLEGISTGKLLTIGIGAILGAVAAEAIVAGEGVTLIGGPAILGVAAGGGRPGGDRHHSAARHPQSRHGRGAGRRRLLLRPRRVARLHRGRPLVPRRGRTRQRDGAEHPRRHLLLRPRRT